MAGPDRDTVIQKGLSIIGSISNGRRVEIFGHVEGDLAARAVLVHETGTLSGRLQAQNAVIAGAVQGEIDISQLLSITSSGAVTGNVRYGHLAMAPGGMLDAKLTNVPPEIRGDFALTVGKGRMVAVTTEDITAFDPDDLPEDLSFAISNVRHGIVTLAGAPTRQVSQFTQADLLAGKVSFVHGGGEDASASFDVIVTDDDGASSGLAKTVKIDVRSGG